MRSALVPAVSLIVALSVAAMGEDAAVRHRFMLAEFGKNKNRIIEISEKGELVWEHRPPGVCVQFQPLERDRVLYAYWGDGTGVREVDRDQRVVWSYDARCEEVPSCHRLANGNTLIGETGPCQIVEVDPRGKLVRTIDVPVKETAAHRQMRCIQGLAKGNVLAAVSGDSAVREIDASGRIVWEYAGATNVFEALRLSNGNTLVGRATDRRILEVSSDGEIVWELTAQDVPEVELNWVTSLQILTNDNLVIGNFLYQREGRGAHAFEVTRDDKQVVWKFADHARVGMATMVRVLEAPVSPKE